MDSSVNLVEVGGLDEEGGDGGRTACDELEVAEGGEKGCAAAIRVLPAFALLEAEGREKLAELLEGVRRGDGLDEGDAFDHVLLLLSEAVLQCSY